MNKPIVTWEPFNPVADLERRIEELTADNTSLCDLVAAQSLMLADKNRELALVQDELAKLKRGQYRLHATKLVSVREVGRGG